MPSTQVPKVQFTITSFASSRCLNTGLFVPLNRLDRRPAAPIRHAYVGHRGLRTSSPKDIAMPAASPLDVARFEPTSTRNKPGLACLPLSHILRTLLITNISSSPVLLGVSTRLLRGMLESKNPIFDIERNPFLRTILWHTFYKQFCAGENSAQITQMCTNIRKQGFAGVIFEYALEVLQDSQSDELKDVATWKKGMLSSVDMAQDGDFLGLKWSGMGAAAMRRMKNQEPPSKEMAEAMHAVCKYAAKKNVAILASAEETWSLKGLDAWTLNLQRVYNRSGSCVVYTTYQAYLKQTPQTLADHLQLSQNEGFILGVKIVRGAYLATEKRELIHPTIEETHRTYDGMAAAVILKQKNDVLEYNGPWPDVRVMLATHNAVSVNKALELQHQQASRGETLIPLVFAQLQGMADDVSFPLLAMTGTSSERTAHIKPKVFKCTAWGSMFECLNYLLRRAAENKDAAGRTKETKAAMWAELVRRMKSRVGLS